MCRQMGERRERESLHREARDGGPGAGCGEEEAGPKKGDIPGETAMT